MKINEILNLNEWIPGVMRFGPNDVIDDELKDLVGHLLNATTEAEIREIMYMYFPERDWGGSLS